ncbi:MAG: UDP-N-acetylglucosamine 2-epimerase [Patescibacteria group bacterium]|jgi:UDP-hydrolysing UDP-N-acetyl-D-glucosamine 2-epimerase
MAQVRKKILIITGTRAEYGLLKSTIDAVRESNKLSLQLLATGMHTLKKHGYSLEAIKKDGVLIDGVVKIKDSDSMIDTLAAEITGINKFCLKNRPDLIIVLGDRDEALAGAIVGSHLGIPVGHIHGGDYTGTIVDGLIRHAVTKLSHLHFTACQKSFERVRLLQENPKNIFLVGAPGLDNLKQRSFSSRKTLAKKLKININRSWLLFLMHPTPFSPISLKTQISNPLKAISRLKEFEKIVIYPNADTGSDIFIKSINSYKKDNSFRIFSNLPRLDYLSLLDEVEFMVGNSSSGVLESTYFKLPVVNIGDRQKYRDRGKNVIDCGYSLSAIIKAIKLAAAPAFREIAKNAISPYGDGGAAKKIVKILENIKEKDLILKKTFT